MDKKNKIILISVHSLFLLVSIICAIIAYQLATHLESQKAAERWRGDNETAFSQISVFIPAVDTLSIDNINTFRSQVDAKIKEQLNDDYVPFTDAYSCYGSLKVSSDRATADVTVIATGGDFFNFHPLKLLSGSYISDKDNDLNRVVIDEELAWLLFGSSNVSGLDFQINGVPFYVAGVVDREDDYTTSKTYTGDMYLFINYRTYANLLTGRLSSGDPAFETSSKLDADPGLTCYEIVLANPVKNFAINLVTEKFPLKNCDIVENTGRFSIGKMFFIMKDFAARVISANGIAYPYWENSARYTENKVASHILASILFIIVPLAAFLFYSGKNIIWTHKKIKGEKLPALKDKIEEAIRIKQRKRWEKKNPDKL